MVNDAATLPASLHGVVGGRDGEPIENPNGPPKGLSSLVKSSSEMQEVALRKQELLRRLRKVRGFENVVDVRFSVNG